MRHRKVISPSRLGLRQEPDQLAVFARTESNTMYCPQVRAEFGLA
jgi:hypothetical protein